MHGTAMGSPVSVVVAELWCNTWKTRPCLADNYTALRYVDDTFTAFHKDEIDDHLNEQKADTQSTKKIEKKGNFFL